MGAEGHTRLEKQREEGLRVSRLPTCWEFNSDVHVFTENFDSFKALGSDKTFFSVFFVFLLGRILFSVNVRESGACVCVVNAKNCNAKLSESSTL